MIHSNAVRLGLIAGLSLALGACDEPAKKDSYTGYVEAELVYIAAPQSGWLVDTMVAEGSAIAEGAPIAALDNTLQRAQLDEAQSMVVQAEEQLREARAALNLATTDLNRARDLVKRGVASTARLDKAQADYKSALARLKTAEANVESASGSTADGSKNGAAQAALAQARWYLDQRNIVARRAGRVEEVFHRKGEFVVAGSPLVSVLPEDGLKVRFFVPQAELAKLTLGAPVQVTHDGAAEAVEGHIAFIAQQAEFTPPVIYSEDARDTLVFMVEARFDGATDLHPGLPVDVRVP